ncbi:chemotaxis protein CheW [Noviherbaspirillum sp. Root189]|uniref:chemotaxis protein CheW n=1 Tax=Noviherbaspirillum sp. Root189 TaxID=1736487 RepID=UPI000710D818|nr:chemotaxis protein CheW [Noviherbaspirillum sp. Root189]KRB90519.1 twitching motility protein PilI [Noviherbaspirillum sp. Root189]
MSPPSLDPGSIAVKEKDSGARRNRLREFQAQLVERMQAASTGTQAQSSQLGVMIGQSRWLINLQEAGEIVSVGAITQVPLTQDWFLGLTNIRGNLISVIDLARFCGMPATPVDKESRIVAFGPSLSFNSGLLVSRVMGLRNVAEMEVQQDDTDDTGHAGNTPWVARRYADRDSQVWTELNLSLIVQDPQFLQVGI